MKMFFILISTLLFTNLCNAQYPGFADPDSIIVGEVEVPQVLLVGSWHFNYPGLDAHKASEENKINIYSEKKQKELEELLIYISRFKPTIVAVESGKNTGYLINNYKRWKAGSENLYANERSQIGMKLVGKFKLDTIYGVDAPSLMFDLFHDKDSLAPKTYIDSIYERHYFGGEDPVSQRYTRFYTYKNEMTSKKTLLENFHYINSEKVLDRTFGAYLAGGQFDSKNFEGADALSMFWYNRNLRIFRNIQTIPHDSQDRILVIFGSGHIPILRNLFEATPQFELIEFRNLK